MEKPNFYAILPADIRYDKRLKPMEKILYSEITSLTNKEGYCYAQNSYFAELYEVHKNTISTWITHLVEVGYLRLEINYYEGTKNIKERRLYISTPINKNIDTPINENVDTYQSKSLDPINKNIDTPINENVDTYQSKSLDPINKNIDTPINENVEDNNKYINNKFNNIYIFQDEKVREKFEYFLEQRRIAQKGLSQIQVDIFAQKLHEHSNGNIKKAIDILDYSIMGNYPQLYPQRTESGSKSKNKYSNKNDSGFEVTEEGLKKFYGIGGS